MVQKEQPGLEEQPSLRVCTVGLDGTVRVEKVRAWVRSSSFRPVVVVEEVADRPERVAGKTEVVVVVGRQVVDKMAELEVVEVVGKMVEEVVEEVVGSLAEEQKRKQPATGEVVEVVDRPVGADIEA